jgi:peptidoglycan/LPS O-acetylase OafA/YrhL
MLIYAFSQTGLEWFFLFGCVTAVLVRVEWVSRVARHELASLLAIACLGAVLLWQPLVYSSAGASLLLVPFLIFASGNSVFGILTCRPARMLGLISYSIYLMHNWVLYLASRAINHFTPVANLTPIEYWLVGLMVVLATLFLSLLTYRFVEYPLLVGPRSQARLDVKIAAN